MAGQGVHRAPQVKDVYKSEVAFTLVPSNLGKKGRTCSYSARLTHNQVLDEETVVSQMCEEFNLPKNRVGPSAKTSERHSRQGCRFATTHRAAFRARKSRNFR